VASNNLFALRGKETSLFDSAKKARALNLDQSVEDRLTIHQRRVFAMNRCLLSLYMNKHKECLTALAKLEKEITGSELPSLVKAALLAREKRLDECSALLQQYATENPTTALRVKLTLAQLQLQQGEKAAAIQTLENIAGAYSQAGVVGSLVKLYELVKDQVSFDLVFGYWCMVCGEQPGGYWCMVCGEQPGGYWCMVCAEQPGGY
jgi:predicted Zn-dependent protease